MASIISRFFWGSTKLVILLAVLITPIAALSQFPRARPVLADRQGIALRDVKSWGYQLQKVDPRAIPPQIDMMVVDYSRNGAEKRAFTTADVDAIRNRPDGSKRIVLAYMSVGEAENYRYYWWSHWNTSPPHWLGAENPNWPGNFPVQFWHPSWARIVVDPLPSTLDRLIESRLPWYKPYLDRVIEAGFDGVYLDRVDVYETWMKDHPAAKDDMVAFVRTISAAAKMRRPGFLVVPQNAEELLRIKAYREAIDGIAKEDLLYGLGGNGVQNSDTDIAASRSLLDRVRMDKRPVFAVEYLDHPVARAEAQRRAATFGYVLNFASRGLNKPPEVMPPLPVLEPLLPNSGNLNTRSAPPTAALPEQPPRDP
jgi:cysteinyl-tRNA synthetase, unknown class